MKFVYYLTYLEECMEVNYVLFGKYISNYWYIKRKVSQSKESLVLKIMLILTLWLKYKTLNKVQSYCNQVLSWSFVRSPLAPVVPRTILLEKLCPRSTILLLQRPSYQCACQRPFDIVTLCKKKHSME